MSIRYRFGQIIESALISLMSARWFPLLRSFARGRYWTYDVCRIAGTRDIRLCLDVGAHIGDVTDMMCRFFPKTTVHAIEPTSATHARLTARMIKKRAVVCHRLALADFEKEINMVVEPLSFLNSLANQAGTETAGKNTDRVAVTTLEKFCRDQSLEEIDVLKIDAQGYDLAVLRGGESLLREGRILFVVVEASILTGDTTNQPLETINAFLAAHGYASAGIYDPVYHGPNNCFLGCFNVLYFHPAGLRRRFPAYDSMAANK